MDDQLSWIERCATDAKVRGSNPLSFTKLHIFMCFCELKGQCLPHFLYLFYIYAHILGIFFTKIIFLCINKSQNKSQIKSQTPLSFLLLINSIFLLSKSLFICIQYFCVTLISLCPAQRIVCSAGTPDSIQRVQNVWRKS